MKWVEPPKWAPKADFHVGVLGALSVIAVLLGCTVGLTLHVLVHRLEHWILYQLGW